MTGTGSRGKMVVLKLSMQEHGTAIQEAAMHQDDSPTPPELDGWQRGFLKKLSMNYYKSN